MTKFTVQNTQANPASERGWAFMWPSHNEREITTNNVFPGGMLMMMLVDSREFPIDESQLRRGKVPALQRRPSEPTAGGQRTRVLCSGRNESERRRQ
jgi:hypothetical protein